MSDVSMYGRVAPKSRSINVEANLLAERLHNQARIREHLRKQLLVWLLSATIIGSMLPILFKLQRSAATSYAVLKEQDGKISDRLLALQKQQDSVKPAIQDKQTMDGIKRHAHELLGQATLFLNNVNPQLALTLCNVQISNSQIEITAQAKAVSYTVAANFVTLTAKSPNATQTVLASMSSDHTMGPAGVMFNLDQKLKVSP